VARQRQLASLRPLRAADLASLAWLPAVAVDAGYDSWSSEDALRAAIDSGRALVPDTDAPEALVAYDTDTPDRRAGVVRFLAVRPERRRLGIGGRTALALEERLAPSVERLYVVVPARIGLALYFWLRLGYRPLTQRDWPALPEYPPSVWMVRSLR